MTLAAFMVQTENTYASGQSIEDLKKQKSKLAALIRNMPKTERNWDDLQAVKDEYSQVKKQIKFFYASKKDKNSK